MNGCIPWTGYMDRNGYGRKGGQWAHRAVYIEAKGLIPDGLELDHLCRNKACVNVDHLQPVTHRENMRRSWRSVRPFCSHGHQYTPETTYIDPRGWRLCRICRNTWVAKFRAKKEAIS